MSERDPYEGLKEELGDDAVEVIKHWVSSYSRKGALAGLAREDLIQEAAIAANQALKAPRDRCSAKTLVSRFVRNRLNSICRKDLGYTELNGCLEEEVCSPSDSESPGDIALLKDALLWLHLEHREEWKAVTLTHIQRLSCEEAAAKLGLSKATVWRQSTTGLARLRNRMGVLDTV